MQDPIQSSSLENVYEKIKEVRVAMLTTEDRTQNILHSRPMSTIKAESDGCLWFFTYDNSEKANEIGHRQRVNVSYSDPDNETYVSVSGEGEIVTDKAKIKELWNPILKAWFPDGMETPHIALMKVKIQQAEYWDSNSNKMVQLYHMAKSIITGKVDKEGKHEKVTVDRNLM